jgi:hypothetical protein
LPRRGVAVVVSILVHALLIAAAARIVWTRLEPSPRSATDFVWLGEWPRPAPAVPVETQPVPVEAPVVEREQAPPQPAVTLSPPAGIAAESPPSSTATQSDNPPVTTGDSPAEQRPMRTDWNEERRRAIADALARQARATEFSAPTLEDLMEARPPPPEPKPDRSIFDPQSSGRGGPSLMQPGQAQTKFGRRAREFCNALTGGGFNLFGFATLCGNAPEYEPSGLFPEVMPEWMKRMPECTETRPLGPLLGESTEFPTIKCRMVPKESEEPLSER